MAELLVQDHSANVDSNDDYNITRLRWAAGGGHEVIVRLLLLNSKADPDLKDENGRTPLSLASQNGHEAVVKLLLDNSKVNPDLKDKFGRRPLSWAVQNGHEAVIKLLLYSGRVDADLKDTASGLTPLSWAARSGRAAVVRLLLDKSKVNRDSKDENGRTPLSFASQNGHETVVKLLLHSGGVDADLKDTVLSRTPLSWAARYGHEAVVRLLLDSDKVDPDSKDRYGVTPLWWAADGGHEAVMRLLLDKSKADPDSKDKNGRTPLSLASQNGHETVVKLLLHSGRVDADLKDTASGRTPLWWAAESGHEVIVMLLLDSGKVDPHSKDENGRILLSWAAQYGHKAVVRLLLDKSKADPNSKDENGRTPLSLAARSGHEAIVRLLLDNDKVDPDSKDEYDVTPLWWAAQSGHEAIMKLLLHRSKVEPDPKAKIGLEIDYRCLSRWIKACNNQHDGYCQPTSVQSRQPHQVPEWVIDTQDGRIVPGLTVSRYIALSYVWQNDQEIAWSPKEERILLKQSNLCNFQKPGYLNGTAAAHLPQVVKDTIDLVRKTGERYLWVDCLCIVQDDGNTRAQVERMGEIYSGAYFTVIGATSSGLFSMQRSANKLRQRDISRNAPLAANVYIEGLYHSLFKSKWATRGWTFQEQILSKRAVIFVDGDMFWDCQRSVWDKDELFPEANAETDGSFTQPYYEMARQISSISRPDFGMYIEMVSLYNSRDLTYPQDALPAISGILNSFSCSFASGFVSGLPRLFFDTALLWQPFSKAKRRIAKDGGMIAPNRHLPSWSWCGWHCPVDPFSLRTGLAYLDREDYQSRALTWRTQGLVQWSVLSEDMQQKQRLDEALTSPSPMVMPQDIWPFLCCRTPRAFFFVGAILKPLSSWSQCAAYKKSVFELPQFTNGPALKDVCHVLCLEDKHGGPAGLLRRMDDAKVELGEKVELIVISSGSVSYKDQESAFEERIDQVCNYSYRHGSNIRFQRVIPDRGNMQNASEAGMFE
jgi:ankyrin repeat protein